MTVRVIKDSVIYNKKIYRCGNEFAISTSAGNSLIEREYVVKISDTPVFGEITDSEEEHDRILLADSSTGEHYHIFVSNGNVYVEEREA